MKQIYRIKSKLPLLLIIGILTLCFAFILINCGLGPQNKIIDSDSGQYAVDLSQAPSGLRGIIYVVSSVLLKRQSSEATAEAWVKGRPDLDGFVFSRHGSEGIAMWIKNNEPKFALRRVVNGTSTDYVVGSGVTLSANTWSHIAGVLTRAIPPLPHPTSSCTEMPHLEIYVGGQLKNCASTGSRSMPDLSTCPPDPITGDPTYGEGTCEGDTLGVGGTVAASGICNVSGTAITACAVGDVTKEPLSGVIDEVRYWTAARTQKEIRACMDQELISNNSGDCGIDNSSLAAYLKLNEGKGSAPSDWTGLGAGSKEDNGVAAEDPARAWDGGWVSGAPITREH